MRIFSSREHFLDAQAEPDHHVSVPANRASSDAPVPLAAAANSGLLVDFSVVSGPASLSNNVLSLLGAGAVTVQAGQLGTIPSIRPRRWTWQEIMIVPCISRRAEFFNATAPLTGHRFYRLGPCVNSHSTRRMR